MCNPNAQFLWMLVAVQPLILRSALLSLHYARREKVMHSSSRERSSSAASIYTGAILRACRPHLCGPCMPRKVQDRTHLPLLKWGRDSEGVKALPPPAPPPLDPSSSLWQGWRRWCSSLKVCGCRCATLDPTLQPTPRRRRTSRRHSRRARLRDSCAQRRRRQRRQRQGQPSRQRRGAPGPPPWLSPGPVCAVEAEAAAAVLGSCRPVQAPSPLLLRWRRRDRGRPGQHPKSTLWTRMSDLSWHWFPRREDAKPGRRFYVPNSPPQYDSILDILCILDISCILDILCIFYILCIFIFFVY